MDAYLSLAEEVLRRVRRPLSAHQILRAAYENGMAPPHLRGRTQHKTLGARLSEDILHQRDASRFYRTAPGRFLLRELADDDSIPEELRRPIVTRRRRRDVHEIMTRSVAIAGLADAISKNTREKILLVPAARLYWQLPFPRYAHAIECKYRFYSYGDASLLLPRSR